MKIHKSPAILIILILTSAQARVADKPNGTVILATGGTIAGARLRARKRAIRPAL